MRSDELVGAAARPRSPPTTPTDDPSSAQRRWWSTATAAVEGEEVSSTLSVQTPLNECQCEELLSSNNKNVGQYAHIDHAPTCGRHGLPDKNRVSPTSILDFPDVLGQEVELELLIKDDDGVPPQQHSDQLSNLQQPAILEAEKSLETDSADSDEQLVEEEEDLGRGVANHRHEISSLISNIFTRSRSPSLATYYRDKPLQSSPSLESGGDDDDDTELSLGETESFDPFAVMDEEDVVADGDGDDNEVILFDNPLEHNVRWSCVSNLDGSVSAHPAYAPSLALEQEDLFATPTMLSATATPPAASPNHSRRVSFDDMMQVRYFSRSQEEKVAMKKFSVMMRQQIRRRRRRSKLNISDSSDEGPDKITTSSKSTTLVATTTKFTSSRGDDDSISGMFADVVDEITDMISEVVIDARRAHERQQEERFFRDLEDGTISGSAIATSMSQGFLHSFGCSPSIISENDRKSSTTIPHNNNDKNSSSSMAPTADDSSTTAHAMAHNIFQTIQNTASLRPTTITTTATAYEEPVKNAEEEDDEPWFCKAMRCGGKCGDL